MKKIRDILEGRTEEERQIIELFKGANFFINADERKVMIACNNILAYQFQVNFGGIRNILTKAIEEKFGKNNISVGPITDILESSQELLSGNLAVPFVLDRDCTFDNFQVSACNESAFKKAFELSQSSSTTRGKKLLYIHADYGQGKTTLLQSMAWNLLKAGKKVACFDSGGFTEFVVDAVTKKPEYRIEQLNVVKKSDALIVDDIHSLQNRERVQLELKGIIDIFFNEHKILAFSSLYPQNHLPKAFLEELSSRMEDGFTVYLSAPDFELKKRLLEIMLENERIVMDDNAKNAALSVEVKNTREFIKILNIIKSTSDLGLTNDNKISLPILAKRLQQNNISIPAVEEEKILMLLKLWYGDTVSISKLKGRILGNNREELIKIRAKIICYVIDQKIFSQGAIARIFNIDKTTVHYILKRNKEGEIIRKGR